MIKHTFIDSSFAGSYACECEILKTEDGMHWIRYVDPISEEETLQWISVDKVKSSAGMKDFFGNILCLGDKVAFCRPKYRDLVMGEIIAFTSQKVRVKYQSHFGKTEFEYLGDPDFFIKKQ